MNGAPLVRDITLKPKVLAQQQIRFPTPMNKRIH